MSEKSETIGKTAATGGLFIAACAVCCAPLIVPPLVALFAAGGVGLALAGQVGLGIAVLGGIVGYLYLRRRAILHRAGGCNCDRGSGCSSSTARGQAQPGAEKG